MSAAADATFDAYVQNTVQSIGRAFEHREFAFHILTNPIRMNQHGSRPPAFDVGYIYRESGAEPTAAAVGFEEMLDIYAPLRREMGLILRVERDGEEIRTNFSYRPDRFREETVDALNSYLTLILEEITEHTGILLRDIGKQSDDGESSPVMESYAEEAFNF
jgi:non-ribosomal peptide synthetase component F